MPISVIGGTLFSLTRQANGIQCPGGTNSRRQMNGCAPIHEIDLKSPSSEVQMSEL